MSELDRIKNNIIGGKPFGVAVLMHLSSRSPNDTLDKIISVMDVLLVAIKSENWPDDAWWKENLPEWFLKSFDYSFEEIQRDQSLWDFGSWVDAAKYRGWEWWSSEITDQEIKIFLEAYDDPYVLGPFEFLIKASGGRNIKVSEV